MYFSSLNLSVTHLWLNSALFAQVFFLQHEDVDSLFLNCNNVDNYHCANFFSFSLSKEFLRMGWFKYILSFCCNLFMIFIQWFLRSSSSSWVCFYPYNSVETTVGVSSLCSSAVSHFSMAVGLVHRICSFRPNILLTSISSFWTVSIQCLDEENLHPSEVRAAVCTCLWKCSLILSVIVLNLKLFLPAFP